MHRAVTQALLPGFGAVTAQNTFGGLTANGSLPRSLVLTTPTAPSHERCPLHDLVALAAPTADVAYGRLQAHQRRYPDAGTDATTKDYVDNLSAGISYKDAVRAATTANITLPAPQTVDGVSLIANDRVLVKDQSTGSQNGIYLVAAGAWTRTTDADAVGELDGAFVVSMEGTANGDKAWICSTNPPITPGTTATTWAYYGAGTAYSAGTGLTLTGSTFDVVAANGSLTVGADNIQVAYAGTGAAVTAARSDHNHDGTYTKKFSQATIGGATSQVVTHNLNTQAVTVSVLPHADAVGRGGLRCRAHQRQHGHSALRRGAGNQRVLLRGGRMSRKFTVPIQLPADPTQPMEAATKQYVDTLAGSEILRRYGRSHSHGAHYRTVV